MQKEAMLMSEGGTCSWADIRGSDTNLSLTNNIQRNYTFSESSMSLLSDGTAQISDIDQPHFAIFGQRVPSERKK